MNLLRALVIFSLGSTSWVHGEIVNHGCKEGEGGNCCYSKIYSNHHSCEGAGDHNGYFSLVENSCVGFNACQGAGSTGGNATISEGACNGGYREGGTACYALAIDNGHITVAENSCIGESSCKIAARTGGYATIARDSCHETDACLAIAGGIRGTHSGMADVGQGSCHGRGVCTSTGSAGGDAKVGSKSCIGDDACPYLGRKEGKVVVRDNSCHGQESCTFMGWGAEGEEKRAASKVTVGDNSCIGKKACYYVGHATGVADSEIFIGSNSCNCPECCTCLEANDVVPDDECNERGPGSCCLGDGQRNAEFDFATTPPGANGDPIILGLKNQVFKFEGRDGAWYSNLSSKNVQWNMQFKEFDSCPADENMFISGMSISTSDNNDKADILIATTSEPIAECREDPNLVCLGEGTLHISFDGGKTFLSQPGDYHFSSRSRVVAHNTYAACSRKWHDYEVSASRTSGLRDGGRRATVQEKKPLRLLSDKKLTMIDPSECNVWIEDRDNKNDLFQQRGHWSTMYIETPLVSFHIEYRRSDWFDPKCDFQSLDAWMTKVSDKWEKTEWHGILGETKTKIYDLMTGEQIKTDRSKLLRGKEDSDYEVAGPFDAEFAALGKHNGLNKVVSSIIESVSK